MMSALYDASTILYALFLMLVLPCTLVSAVVLCFRKDGIPKGLWIANIALGILGFILLVIMDFTSKAASVRDFSIAARTYLRPALLHLFCYFPALLFPLIATTGYKGAWKPVFLLPALILSIADIFSYPVISMIPMMLLLYFPMVLTLLLMAIWYYTGKKTWFGVLLALYIVGNIILLPLLCIGTGASMIHGLKPLDFFYALRGAFSDLPRGGLRALVIPLRSSGFPLAAYALLSQFAIAGIHSKRLPKEKVHAQPAAKPIAVPPAAPAAAAAPAASRFCAHCGNKLEGNAKFCAHCGKPV